MTCLYMYACMYVCMYVCMHACITLMAYGKLYRVCSAPYAGFGAGVGAAGTQGPIGAQDPWR